MLQSETHEGSQTEAVETDGTLATCDTLDEHADDAVGVECATGGGGEKDLVGFTRSGVDRRNRLHKLEIANKPTFLTAGRKETTEESGGDPGHGPFSPDRESFKAPSGKSKQNGHACHTCCSNAKAHRGSRPGAWCSRAWS